MPKQKYEENPTRGVNMAIGGGLGVLLGGVLLGFPGALVGGGIGAVLGSERGDTRRRRELLENRRTCPRGTQVQTLLFDRDKFTRAEAIAWARRNGYVAHKIDTTANKYRLRQKAPSHFTRGSFRTIMLSDRVEAVIGCPR